MALWEQDHVGEQRDPAVGVQPHRAFSVTRPTEAQQDQETSWCGNDRGGLSEGLGPAPGIDPAEWKVCAGAEGGDWHLPLGELPCPSLAPRPGRLCRRQTAHQQLGEEESDLCE